MEEQALPPAMLLEKVQETDSKAQPTSRLQGPNTMQGDTREESREDLQEELIKEVIRVLERKTQEEFWREK